MDTHSQLRPSISSTAIDNEVGASYTIVAVHDVQSLEDHVDAWHDLTRSLAEPNAFYEPWALMPAIRHFGDGLDLSFVLVYLTSSTSSQPILCGFFPLQRRQLHRALPIPVVELWQHIYCSLCTPLLRQGHATPALEAFVRWLKNDQLGAPLLRLNHVSGDGAFIKALMDICNRWGRPTHLLHSHCRALIVPRDDAESYIRAALSGNTYKGYRRRQRILAARGRFEHRVYASDDDADAWAEMLLQLEAKGWKGREGTALLCRSTDAAFVRDMLRGASSAGKLMMSGLFLDGEPLALQSNFRSGTASFAFKIAYDEAYGSSSPGALLELANIRGMHSTSGAEWMDSCTAAGNALMNRLWTERRLIVDQYISTGRPPGDLFVSALPLLRWLKRSLSRPRAAALAVLNRP